MKEQNAKPAIQYHIVQDMKGNVLYVSPKDRPAVEALYGYGKYYKKKHKQIRIIDVHEEKGVLTIRDAIWNPYKKHFIKVKGKALYIQIPLKEEVRSMLERIIKKDF